MADDYRRSPYNNEPSQAYENNDDYAKNQYSDYEVLDSSGSQQLKVYDDEATEPLDLPSQYQKKSQSYSAPSSQSRVSQPKTNSSKVHSPQNRSQQASYQRQQQGNSQQESYKISQDEQPQQIYINVNQNNNQQQVQMNTQPVVQKSKIVALLLCFFFGYLGIQRFYLGWTGSGFCMLLLFLLSFIPLLGLIPAFIVGIWAVVDFFRILFGNLKPKDGIYT